MSDRSLGNDLATIGVGIGIPLTFILGIVLLFTTGMSGRAPIWLIAPFAAIALGSGISYLMIRRDR